MATGSKLGTESFLAGSSIEGNAYSNHLAQQPMQDFDFMFIEGAITSPECILKLENAPGFVQIKYDERFIEIKSKTQLSTQLNQNQILCINGFKMKEKYCGIDTSTLFPYITTTGFGETTTASASTAFQFKSVFEPAPLDEQFERILNYIRRLRTEQNVEKFQSKFIVVCNMLRKSMSQSVLPMLGNMATHWRLSEENMADIVSLSFPMYNVRIPQVNQVRLNALLDYYEKYKHIGDASALQDQMEYFSLAMNYESDMVPALKLDFWPDDVQVFLNRVKTSRPELYKIIQEQSCMHVIPKWSSKTSPVDQELEFRYSFSAVERILAHKRTRVQKILNGVARSIYSRYLKKVPSVEDPTKHIVPSYFVKTTVLWMCELYDLDDLCLDSDDDQTIAYIMAMQWLDYAKTVLESGNCQHYFIDSLNLLETCSSASVARAVSILENDVNLDEDVKINVLMQQNEFLKNRKRTHEEWIKAMKVGELLAAVDDYRILRDNWLYPAEDHQMDDEVPNVLFILSQLRMLDGDKCSNWQTFRRLFLQADQSNWLSPLWDEQVAERNLDDFAESIVSLGSNMRGILESMEKSDLEQQLAANMEQNWTSSVRNILNDLTFPTNIIQNGLATSSIPLLTSPYFNTATINLPSLQQRSVLESHPYGPLQNFVSDYSGETPITSAAQQKYNSFPQNASNTLIDLLNRAPDKNMTIGDLIKYYNHPPKKSESLTTAEIQEEIDSRATNFSSTNKESYALVIFDPDRFMDDITDDIFRQINDYTLIYRVPSQLLTYVQSVEQEHVFIILCRFIIDDKQFLSQLNNLNQVHSIFIYSSQELAGDQLKKQYRKLIGAFTDQEFLWEQVRIRMEQSLACRLGFYDPQEALDIHTKLSKESSLFFWNLLLKDLLELKPLTDKDVMIEESYEYYNRNTTEMENIKRFQETYDSKNAWEWFSTRCFISQVLTKAFHTANIEQLKLLNFFIRDLSPTANESATVIERLYCVKTIEKAEIEQFLEKIGQLINFSGFLLARRSFIEAVPYGNDSQMTVVFEMNNVSTSSANIIDSDRVIVGLGVPFKLDSLNFDEKLGIWIVRLIFSDEGQNQAQNFIVVQQQIMEKMTLPVIMGSLLINMNEFNSAKVFFENLQDEDKGSVYFFRGTLNYLKGEYNLALSDFQIAYEFMVSEERILDSSKVLHDIGYVYDMKKESDEALECHLKALDIRQLSCPMNDARIGISLYNIGRTLVNMRKNEEALIYHQNALKIFEQTLTYTHRFMALSLHSHAVVYLHAGDYQQAFHYCTRALEIYETMRPRDEKNILTIKNMMEKLREYLA